MKALVSSPQQQVVSCLMSLLLVLVGVAQATPVMAAQTANQNPPPAASQTPQAKQDSTTPAPVGTAAAPDMRPSGVSAATTAGAAIAPGKQKRIRRFSIRTALLIGGAVAIGVVTAASLSSPSRPH